MSLLEAWRIGGGRGGGGTKVWSRDVSVVNN